MCKRYVRVEMGAVVDPSELSDLTNAGEDADRVRFNDNGLTFEFNGEDEADEFTESVNEFRNIYGVKLVQTSDNW